MCFKNLNRLNARFSITTFCSSLVYRINRSPVCTMQSKVQVSQNIDFPAFLATTTLWRLPSTVHSMFFHCNELDLHHTSSNYQQSKAHVRVCEEQAYIQCGGRERKMNEQGVHWADDRLHDKEVVNWEGENQKHRTKNERLWKSKKQSIVGDRRESRSVCLCV